MVINEQQSNVYENSAFIQKQNYNNEINTKYFGINNKKFEVMRRVALLLLFFCEIKIAQGSKWGF